MPLMINTIAFYNQYFKSIDGRNREWKVVQESPNFTLPDYKSIYVRCWFPALNVVVRVDVLAVAAFADEFEMVAIIAYVNENLVFVTNINKDKSAALSKYATLAGDDPQRRTHSQN